MAQLDFKKTPIAPFIYGVCEHTQGYNSSPIAIIFDIYLVWVIIMVLIVNEPYPTWAKGPSRLRKLLIGPFTSVFCPH